MDIGRTLPADVAQGLLSDVVSYKSMYEALCKLVADAVIELDPQGKVERWNFSAEAMTGYAAQSVIGKNFRELLPDRNLNRVLSIPVDGLPHEMRFSLLEPDGAQIELRGYGLALKAGDALEGWLISFAASKRLDEIEQLKNEFVSTVSHELKTPLAAVKAYTATLLANPDLDKAERAEYLRVIDQQSDRLTRLIDDLLLVTRVDAGQMLKRRVKLSLRAILDRVISEMNGERTAHPIVLAVDNVMVSGDPDRLVDIFSHLLDNAVKYSPAGGTITVEAFDEGRITRVCVRDEGVGITEDHLPFIFDRFYRIDNDITSAVGGSGLGLFLVHSLVRAHGGNIDVRSDPGKGSTFTITLPVRE